MLDRPATSNSASVPLALDIERNGQGGGRAVERDSLRREYQDVEIDNAKVAAEDCELAKDRNGYGDRPKYGSAYSRSDSSYSPSSGNISNLPLLPSPGAPGRSTNPSHPSTANPTHKDSPGTKEHQLKYDIAPWYSRERYFGALLMNLGTAFIPALYGTLSIMWVGGLGGAGGVAVAVSYTYAGVVVECFNGGLPRAVWYVDFCSSCLRGFALCLRAIRDCSMTDQPRILVYLRIYRVGCSVDRRRTDPIGQALRYRSTTTNRTSFTESWRHTQIRTLITVQTLLCLCILVAFLASARAFVGAFVPQGTDVEMSVKYVRLSSGSLAVGLVNTAIGLGTRALDHPE